MAKMITPGWQQVQVRRDFPKPAYSRVINLTLQVPAGLGNDDFAVSPGVGNRIWLLSVTLNLMSQTRANVFGGFIYISTGTDKRVDAEKIAVDWDPVIRQYGGPKPAFYYTGFGDSYSWDMMRLYVGSGRKFGAMASNLFASESWRAWISLEISEG